ncbi:unnamed protein product [Ceratitis capitata]|uniref:(Mediterranean fruit fly) hypothetical protein n=1 Tax=Ceratitis capitata TaxID=7213 RepID=A0A811V4F9_CERCA|nr:unnamed protein product [Ceratitis capitata]
MLNERARVKNGPTDRASELNAKTSSQQNSTGILLTPLQEGNNGKSSSKTSNNIESNLGMIFRGHQVTNKNWLNIIYG